MEGGVCFGMDGNGVADELGADERVRIAAGTLCTGCRLVRPTCGDHFPASQRRVL
jgi:hypothetical protein